MNNSGLLNTLNAEQKDLLKDLIKCQSEIDSLSENQSEENREVFQKFENIKKPFVDRRSELIGTVPSFWLNAMDNHPQLCFLLGNETVKDVLSYMTKIESEDDVEHQEGVSFKIHFSFKENPYFENERLTKEIILLKIGQIKSKSTAIKLKINQTKGPNDESNPSECHYDSNFVQDSNFFGWFCDNKNIEDDVFTYFQAISRNPLPYSSFFNDSSDVMYGSSCFETIGDQKTCAITKDVANLTLNDNTMNIA